MDTIPFHHPFIGPEEEEAVIRVLRSGWLTTGKEALAFEEEFGNFLGQGFFCLAVNSATSGLHLALEALRIGPGDAVFLPTYTFTATAEVVRYLGAEIVFVDIAPDSYNMDNLALERAIHGFTGTNVKLKPKAIIVVHFGGLPCDMTAINRTAQNYDLAVVEDAAHAFPVRTLPPSGPWAGTCSDTGVFSFYATKTITTGEGGMVVTEQEDLARRISIMRSHGIDRSVWNRYTDNAASWYYEVTAPGYKYNLPDLLAAVGRVQLGRAMELLAMRKKIAERYDQAFVNNSSLIIPPREGARHLYTIRLRKPEGRDSFIESLRSQGIGCSVHFIPLHLMPYYRERYGLKPEDYPESAKRYLETVSLPIWPGMSEAQVDRVIESVKRSL
ncbi:MAG: DegT/DnrJ/EryC1/StrS family aminotransferase [Treponema sp.]|jgi:dTDP-4-amino-4,6-dideoxygalactose transaminase|nr:DegT/DnrJ/EryC1/StrS family aminotransferase [Treponema sp.]